VKHRKPPQPAQRVGLGLWTKEIMWAIRTLWQFCLLL